MACANMQDNVNVPSIEFAVFNTNAAAESPISLFNQHELDMELFEAFAQHSPEKQSEFLVHAPEAVDILKIK